MLKPEIALYWIRRFLQVDDLPVEWQLQAIRYLIARERSRRQQMDSKPDLDALERKAKATVLLPDTDTVDAVEYVTDVVMLLAYARQLEAERDRLRKSLALYDESCPYCTLITELEAQVATLRAALGRYVQDECPCSNCEHARTALAEE